VRLLATPAIVLLGEASYGLYILHWPLAVFWQHLAPGSSFWLYAATAVTLSVASYRYLETPVRRWLRVHLTPAPAAARAPAPPDPGLLAPPA
jgi:peptidoglycan/LPS O-acetylase OafA/YrhL